MKKLFSQSPFILCGLSQIRHSKPWLGWLLGFAFWDCFFIGLYILWQASNATGMAIGFLCELLAGLLWLYSYLDHLETVATIPPSIAIKQQVNEKTEEAAKEEEEEVQSNQESVVLDHYEVGRIAYLRKELHNARSHFEKALYENKEDNDSLFQLARIHYDLGEKQKARHLFERYSTAKGSKKWQQEAAEYLEQLN